MLSHGLSEAWSLPAAPKQPLDLFSHLRQQLWQVDILRPGLLGHTREAFSARYCGRRLVPSARSPDAKRWDNGGLSHAHELHALLAQVLSPAVGLAAAAPACDLHKHHKRACICSCCHSGSPAHSPTQLCLTAASSCMPA